MITITNIINVQRSNFDKIEKAAITAGWTKVTQQYLWRRAYEKMISGRMYILHIGNTRHQALPYRDAVKLLKGQPQKDYRIAICYDNWERHNSVGFLVCPNGTKLCVNYDEQFSSSDLERLHALMTFVNRYVADFKKKGWLQHEQI